MKQSTAFPLGTSLRRLLFLLAFSPVTLALGQPGTAKNTSITTSSPKAPIAKNMKDYAKTPQGIKRAQKYAKTFAGGASNGTASKDIKYPDGTALHLKMVRNPSFGDQPTEITAKVKADKDKPVQSKDPKVRPGTAPPTTSN